MQKIDNIRYWQKLLKVFKVQQGGEDPLLLSSTVLPIIDLNKPYIEDYVTVAVTNTDTATSTGFRKDQRFLLMGYTYYFENTGSLTATCTASLQTDMTSTLPFAYFILQANSVKADTVMLSTPILCKANTGISATTGNQTGFFQLAAIGVFI